MKIADIAAQLGVSKQAVYQRIKRAGLNINMLKDPKSGDLLDNSADIIVNLFTDKSTLEVEKSTMRVDHSTNVDALVTELNDYKQRVEALNTHVCEVEKQLTEVAAERDYLRDALTAAQTALNQSQQLQAMTLQRMLPEPRQGVVARFFSIFTRAHEGK